jgi:hypothetical protein
MPSKRFVESLKTAGQVFAVLLLVAYGALLLHKGSIDLAAIVQAHPGPDFWPALGRHLMRVLGGG